MTVNVPPIAVDVSARTQVNTPVTFSATANDTDADGAIDPATVDLNTGSAGRQITATIPGEGLFAVDDLGNVTFTPEAGFTGVSTTAYTVNDNNGGISNSANISVTVNAPPVANNDTPLTQIDTPVAFDVTINDTASDGTVDITTVDLNPAWLTGKPSLPSSARACLVSTVQSPLPRTPFYRPSTTYTIGDNDGGTSSTATITVTVNVPPIAMDDTGVTRAISRSL